MKKIGMTVMTVLFSAVAFAQPGTDRIKTVAAPRSNQPNLNLAGIKEGWYYIGVKETGKYLAVEGGNPNNGARIVQWDFAEGDNHRFYIKRSDQAGYFHIMPKHSGRYLNVANRSNAEGANIIQWDFSNDDNMKFAAERDLSSDGIVLVGKQSNHALLVAGVGNGAALVTTANRKAQHFVLVEAKPLSERLGGQTVQSFLNTTIIIPQAGGVPIRRTLQHGGVQRLKAGQIKRNVKDVGGDGQVRHKIANMTGVVRPDMTVLTNGDLLLNYSPGMIYDVRDLYGGNVLNKEKFRNGENRHPMNLVTTVLNLQTAGGPISKNVEVPQMISLRQAIADLNYQYQTEPHLTSVANFNFFASDVVDKTEMGFNIGASGNYLFASGSSNIEIRNSKETRKIYIEGVKELFTLKAVPGPNGLLQNTADIDVRNLGYIQSVTYGVRVVGIVEIANTADEISAAASAGVSFGFAGGSVNFATWNKNKKSEARVKLYVVGGQSVSVGSCTLATIDQTINDILRSANYKVAQPLKVAGATLDGQLINFQDATDNYAYDEYTPGSVNDAAATITVTLNTLSAVTDDDLTDIYGNIWVAAFDKNKQLLRPVNGDNHLFATGQNKINMEDQRNKSLMLNKTVQIEYPAGAGNGGYIDIVFQVLEEDANTDYGEGDDDLFVFQEYAGVNKSIVKFPNGRPKYAIYRIAVNDIPGADKGINERMIIDGDEINVFFTIRKTPRAN